jgi:general secretion pathway protein J
MKPRRADGFTLLELIIAMALIGMALALGFSALRLAARSMESTDRLVNDLEELRVARAVVQRQLSQALPLRESLTERQVNFHGEIQQVEFIAPAPSQGERMVGLYRYRLRMATKGETQGLLLEYQPYEPGPPRDWPPSAESTLLVSNIKECEFSYFGIDQGEVAEWQTRWSRVERMPRMVRVAMLRGAEGTTPLELVVALPVERGR